MLGNDYAKRRNKRAAEIRPRILFFHSEVRSYRIELFERIAKNFDTTFIFLHQTRYADSIPAAKKWHYLYLRPSKIPAYAADACWGVIPYLFKHRREYDLVIFSGIFSFATHVGVPIAKILGKKVILWDETWLLPGNLLAKMSIFYLKWLVASADALVAAGSKARELYLRLGASSSKCFIAPNCAVDIKKEIDQAQLDRLAEKIGRKKDQLIIGYLGRIVYYKALDTLIVSFCAHIRPKFPLARLLIVGDGPYADNCRELLNKYGRENVVWVGGDINNIEPVSHHEFIHYLALTDIFVLPGRFVFRENVPAEAWGLSLNEAMSLSKPVLSTKSVAGAFDLIEEGVNGYLVEEDNIARLSEALGKLLGDHALRRQAGIKSREIIVQRFNYEKMYQGFVRAIEYTEKANVMADD